MATDMPFGDTGSIWTTNPETRPGAWDAAGLVRLDETHYVGGDALSCHMTADGPAVVFTSWSADEWFVVPPGSPTPPTDGDRLVVSSAHFGSAGRPGAEQTDRAPRIVTLSPAGTNAWVLATCSDPGGQPMVLMRLTAVSGTWTPPAYRVVVDTAAGLRSIPVAMSSVFDPPSTVRPMGNVRLAAAGADIVIVSTYADQVLFCRIDAAGNATVRTTHIGGAGSVLPGIIRLTVASLQPAGPAWSLAMTADLDLPGLGAVSAPALLRLTADGAIDTSFGDGGLWRSPITNVYRQVSCIGAFERGVVGYQGADVLAFANGSGGDDLDDTFGDSGTLTLPFAAGILSAVMGTDGHSTFVFARTTDGAMTGQSFDRAGSRSGTFGVNGYAVVPADGTPATLRGVVVSGGTVLVATTRQIEGLDTASLPVLTELDAATGQPIAAFGAGGLTFHAATGYVAALGADGTAHVTHRHASEETMRLRHIDANGRFLRTITVPDPPGFNDAAIRQVWPLDDGGLLVAGDLGEWFARLEPDGTLDSTFGTGGFALPPSAAPRSDVGLGEAPVIGVLPSGGIAIYRSDSGIGFINPDGSFDTSYAAATGNYAPTPGFTYIAWPRNLNGHVSPVFAKAWFQLETDGSVIYALGSQREDDADPNVEIALRRIAPDGTLDPNFGIGPVGLTARAGSPVGLFEPQGAVAGAELFTRAEPVGMVRLGNMLYLVVWAEASGRDETFDVLVVVRFKPDGTGDPTFGTTGVVARPHQEAGFYPQRHGFRPTGLVALGDDIAYVYGTAGFVDQTHRQRPEPALFRLTHPGGIGTTFGQGGAERVTMPEFEAVPLTARLVSNRAFRSRHLRFVATDVRARPSPSYGRVVSNFGVVGQFTVAALRPFGPLTP
jgi:uncharacterized delta-60 repeat protein